MYKTEIFSIGLVPGCSFNRSWCQKLISLLYPEIKHPDWMLKVTCIVSTNQSALFLRNVVKLLLSLFKYNIDSWIEDPLSNFVYSNLRPLKENFSNFERNLQRWQFQGKRWCWLWPWFGVKLTRKLPSVKCCGKKLGMLL